MEIQLVGGVHFTKDNLNKGSDMEFKEFQEKSKNTDQKPKDKENNKEMTSKDNLESEIIPLLGLVGEAGVLLSEYKKKLRDGDEYVKFRENIKEELGDLLWYISNLASKFNLNLNDIAVYNLKKTKDLWGKDNQKRELYDESFPIDQQLPREFSYKIEDKEGKTTLTDIKTGRQIGNNLTDNSYNDDGYRYHDIMHLTFMAHFGWSPVLRKLLRSKEQEKGIQKLLCLCIKIHIPPLKNSRKPIIKGREKREGFSPDAEDGGKAQIIDETIVLMSYLHATTQYNFPQNGNIPFSGGDLKFIQRMVHELEVKDISTNEWIRVIKLGFENWKKLIDHNGGIIHGDLNKKTISVELLK